MRRVAALSFSGLAVVLMAVAPVRARAQAPADTTGAPPGAAAAAAAPPLTPAVSFGAWAGFAHRSPAGLWGTTPGRDLGMVALRMAWTLYEDTGVAVDYTMDVVPAAYLTRERIEVVTNPSCPKGQVCTLGLTAVSTLSAGSAYGFGLAPVGVELRFRPTRRIQPFMGVSAGALHFTERIPSPRGSRVNFIANLGGGVQLTGPGGFALVLGYKLFHLSNAGQAVSNPGVDNNLVYVGVVRR